jgi:hypothetical protein
MRWALFSEIVVMSWETLRGNKMRSFLTVLGIDRHHVHRQDQARAGLR